MVTRRAIGTCCVALLLFAATLAGSVSEVADAAMKADKQTLRSLLQRRVDVNTPQADGATALHWAVWREDPEMVTMLIRAGANVNGGTKEQYPPLFIAAAAGHVEVVRELIAAGSDANQIAKVRWEAFPSSPLCSMGASSPAPICGD